MLKIGFVGLDTSHVTAFARLLDEMRNEGRTPAGKVTMAWPGGSPDFALSRDRVEGFTRTLRDEHGVAIAASPEEVAGACDVVFIESVDGRVHLEQFRRVAPFRKPTFVDKPFATTLADAREMLRLAAAHGVALMSCSSLRYAEALQAALARGRGDIVGCDAFGPASEAPPQPGLFWYGCHGVEMMVAAMGAGCREVRCLRTRCHDLLTAVWHDGRVASCHGLREAHAVFGITLHRREAAEVIDPQAGRPAYAGLLDAILGSLPQGRSAVPAEEMLQVVAILEAANRSRENDGAPVAAEDVRAPAACR